MTAAFAFDIKGKLDSEKVKKLMGPSTDVLTGYLDNQPDHPARSWNAKQLELVQRYRPWWLPAKAISMVDLAKKMTYGSADKPARPFLEEGIGFDMNAVNMEVGKHYKAVNEGQKDRAQSLKALGAFLVGQVVEFMSSDVYKSSSPNSAITQEIKGSDQPLIDTGLLRQSIHSEVRSGISSGAEE